MHPANKRLLFHVISFSDKPALLREFVIKNLWAAARMSCEQTIETRKKELVKLENMLEQLKVLEKEDAPSS
jgi:hypothetical protein